MHKYVERQVNTAYLLHGRLPLPLLPLGTISRLPVLRLGMQTLPLLGIRDELDAHFESLLPCCSADVINARSHSKGPLAQALNIPHDTLHILYLLLDTLDLCLCCPNISLI